MESKTCSADRRPQLAAKDSGARQRVMLEASGLQDPVWFMSGEHSRCDRDVLSIQV